VTDQPSLEGRLRTQLTSCLPGRPGWRAFESAATETLTYLLVPPLQPPHIQARTLDGTEIRDALFPNRNFNFDNNFGRLWHELSVRILLFEFKNYDVDEISGDEVIQTSGYSRPQFGRLAILCSNKEPNASARRRRNTIFSTDRRVILFLTTEHLLEMLDIKERGEDPSDFIMDLLDQFYIQHD
jgi:hypothetical protein